MRARARIGFPQPAGRLAWLVLGLAPLWLLPGGERWGPAGLALLGFAVIIDVVFHPAPLELERELPPSVGLGDRADGVYRVRSAWPRKVRLSVHDRLPAAVARESALGDEVEIPARGGIEIPLALTGRARGIHALGECALRVDGQLRLTRRTHRFTTGDEITVAPTMREVRRYRLLAVQHRLRDAGVRAIRRRGEGTSFAGLREYVAGDDPRRLDWKATARRGRPMAREYTVEQGQTVLIGIDAGRMMTQLAGELSRFEHALAAAMVLADTAVASGDRVGLIVFDDVVRAFVSPAKGRGPLQGIRRALIGARARLVEPDYAAAFRTLAERHRKRSLVVLFTDVIDVRSSQALIAHASRGAARHLPVVVALRNDALEEAARTAEGMNASALYEAAAAEELLGARHEALLRMRQAGVSVLDVSPQAMTAAVVNRYLELKARALV